MGAHAIQHTDNAEQLALYEGSLAAPAVRSPHARVADHTRMCAACRAHEARYGFRDREDDPLVGRPNTLCFDCFRMEIDRRQAAAAQLARGWNATQASCRWQESSPMRQPRRAARKSRHATRSNCGKEKKFVPSRFVLGRRWIWEWDLGLGIFRKVSRSRPEIDYRSPAWPGPCMSAHLKEVDAVGNRTLRHARHTTEPKSNRRLISISGLRPATVIVRGWPRSSFPRRS